MLQKFDTDVNSNYNGKNWACQIKMILEQHGLEFVWNQQFEIEIPFNTIRQQIFDMYYTFYRKDRNNGNSRGGGVGFFIADNLHCKVRFDLSPNNAELLWLEIKTNQKRILVGVCYRPPGQSRDDQLIKHNSEFL